MPSSTPGNIIIQQTSNALALALAPTLASQAATRVPDPDSSTTVLVTIHGFTPNPWGDRRSRSRSAA